jgi:hypothetical protein
MIHKDVDKTPLQAINIKYTKEDSAHFYLWEKVTCSKHLVFSTITFSSSAQRQSFISLITPLHLLDRREVVSPCNRPRHHYPRSSFLL